MSQTEQQPTPDSSDSTNESTILDSINQYSRSIDTQSIISRIKELVRMPETAWNKIAAEETSVKELFTKYLVVLAAVSGLANFLSLLLWGVPGLPFSPSFSFCFRLGLNAFILPLAATYVLGHAVHLLAPKFLGHSSLLNAMKLIGYSYSVVLASSVLLLIPVVGLLGMLVVGIYSLVIMWKGITPLVGVPDSQRAAFFVVLLLTGFVVGIVTSRLFSVLLGIG